MSSYVEKREPWCTDDGNINWCSHCGTSKETPQNFKIEVSGDPSILSRGIYVKEMKALSQTDICTTLFIVALVTITKT